MGRDGIKENRRISFGKHQTENDIDKVEDVNKTLLSNDLNSIHSSDGDFVGFCKQTAVNDDKNLQTYKKLVGKGLNFVYLFQCLNHITVLFFCITCMGDAWVGHWSRCST